MLISLIVGLITARYLGPTNYGLVNYAAAYTAFFSSLSSLGINSVLVKELIDHPEENGEILGSSIMMRLISGGLSALTIVSVVMIIDRNEPVTIMAVGLASLGLIVNAFETFNYWFQSKLKSNVTAVALLLAYAITAIYKVYLVVTGKSVIYFALATSIDYVCLAAILFLCYKKEKGQILKVSIATCKRILSHSRHFILPGLMVAIYGQTDKLMLKQMISETEIGYYSTAVSICGMWTFILAAIIDSMYPVIMQSNRAGDYKKFEKLNKQLYAIVFYISVLVSIAIAFLAEPIVLILYGIEYLPAVAPLRVITWYTAFSYLGVARNAWIVSMNKQNYLIWVYLASAAANVVLNCMCIPLWGAVGAALASLVAQIFTIAVVPFFIKPIRRNAMLMIEAICFKNFLTQTEAMDS